MKNQKESSINSGQSLVAPMVMLDWMRKMHRLEYAHRYESTRLQRLNILLGVSATVSVAAMGAIASVPGSAESSGLFMGTLSLIGVVCSSLLTFLRPAEAAEVHRTWSSKFEQMRHGMEHAVQANRTSRDLMQYLERIQSEWGHFQPPNVSPRSFDLAGARVRELQTYPQRLVYQASHFLDESDPLGAPRESD